MDRKNGKKNRLFGMCRVPLVMQLEAAECGAACLSMVMASYGRWVSLEELRMECGVSRDGSRAGNLVRAARNYGMECQGYRVETVEELKEVLSGPVILFWNGNHFVVLKGFSRGRAYINDPAWGSYTLDTGAFMRSFSNIVLVPEPGEGFEKKGHRRSPFLYAVDALMSLKATAIFVLLLTLVLCFVNIFAPYFERIFMDRVMTNSGQSWFYFFFISISIFTFAAIASRWMKVVNNIKINGKLAVTSVMKYMWHVMRLPMEFFSQRGIGDILLRLSFNENVAYDAVNLVIPLFFDCVLMAVYFVMLIRYNLEMAIVGLVGIGLNLLTVVMFSGMRINAAGVKEREEANLSTLTISIMEEIETIKAGGAEDRFFSRWHASQTAVNNLDADIITSGIKMNSVPRVVERVTGLLIMIIGIEQVMAGNFTLGMLMAFQGYFTAFMEPAERLIDNVRSLFELRNKVERVDDVMNCKEVPENEELSASDFGEEGGKGLAKLGGDISIKDVTYGYSKTNTPVISGLSLDIKKGETVAVVGPSGCGKSTLAKLLTGLAQPWSGEILYDGRPRMEIAPSVFNASVGLLDQDVALFEDTIESNIKTWDLTVEDFDVTLAAIDADMQDVILNREGGYKHLLKEDGRNFSGGQRQRMEMARVLAMDPSILILDEGTSALDVLTEKRVLSRIRNRGITCILISHRISAVRDSDRIIVMDKGSITEMGKHEELFAKRGLYYNLLRDEGTEKEISLE